jgi:hypothetical protein
MGGQWKMVYKVTRDLNFDVYKFSAEADLLPF